MNTENTQEINTVLEQAMAIIVMAKNNMEAYSDETHAVIQKFNQILESNKIQSETLIRESHHALSKTMKDSVILAINDSTHELEEKLKRSANVLLNAVDDFHAHKNTIIHQSKWFSWKSIFLFIIGIGMILAGVYKFSYDSYNKYTALVNANHQLDKKIADKQALLETRVFSCGKAPCLRIDENTEAWSDGKHKYMLLK